MSAKEMVKGIMRFLKVTGLRAIAEQQFGFRYTVTSGHMHTDARSVAASEDSTQQIG